MISVIENGKYIILDRLTKEITIENLNLYVSDNFVDAMGLENVIFHVQVERVPHSDDKSSDDERSNTYVYFRCLDSVKNQECLITTHTIIVTFN